MGGGGDGGDPTRLPSECQVTIPREGRAPKAATNSSHPDHPEKPACRTTQTAAGNPAHPFHHHILCPASNLKQKTQVQARWEGWVLGKAEELQP